MSCVQIYLYRDASPDIAFLVVESFKEIKSIGVSLYGFRGFPKGILTQRYGSTYKFSEEKYC